MKDLRLDDGDVVFTAAGDLETVEDGAVVAQDVGVAFATAKGALHWDETAGSSFPHLVNAPAVDAGAIESEAEDILLADDRIDPDETEVTVSSADEGVKLVADFRVSGAGMERAEAEIGGSS
jgi:hypothetical protein